MHDLTSILNHYQLKLVQHARVINWKVSCAKAGCQITRNDYVGRRPSSTIMHYIQYIVVLYYQCWSRNRDHGIPPFGDHKILGKYDVLNHQVLVLCQTPIPETHGSMGRRWGSSRFLVHSQMDPNGMFLVNFLWKIQKILGKYSQKTSLRGKNYCSIFLWTAIILEYETWIPGSRIDTPALDAFLHVLDRWIN